MRIILLATAAFFVTGAAGAAEPTRLDAAQLDWITASVASAPDAPGARPTGGTLADRFAALAAEHGEEKTVDGPGPVAKGVTGVVVVPGDVGPAGAGPGVAALDGAGAGDAGPGGMIFYPGQGTVRVTVIDSTGGAVDQGTGPATLAPALGAFAGAFDNGAFTAMRGQFPAMGALPAAGFSPSFTLGSGG